MKNDSFYNINLNNKTISLKFTKNKMFKFLNNKKIIEILKLLKIILKFYLNNKKILFIGTSDKLSYFFKLIYKFKNISYIWHPCIKGFLTNSFVFKSLSLTNKPLFKFFLNFSPEYDLIVTLNNFNNKETFKLKKPVINFNQFLININNFKQKIYSNNLYLFFIYQIFLKFKNISNKKYQT